ncbi:unnamed protein product [Adineta steineri]|uniref:hexokinase n=2 Tax=Adineta steineri TaxID=433720 RepID=A0A815WHK7_9BILA|nr:unnamed protein product [Adineta steineri]CAF1545426.1 unnamed protein product [Adineta steineri]
MSDMSATKQLAGDMNSPAPQHSEVPLGTSTDNNVSSTNNNMSTWAMSNLQKLNVTELYTQQRQSLRPWLDFFNTNQFKPPANIKAGARRLVFNVEHFQTNYFIVIIILSIYCIITTPALLFILLAMGAGCYLVSLKNRESPLTIMNHQIAISQQYLAVFCLCVPLLLMVGAGSAIFWILGASVFVIFLHALFHQTPNQEAFGVQMEEMAPSSDYILEFKIDVFKTLKIVGITTGVLTAIGLGAYYIHRRTQSSKRVILRDEVRNILRPFQLTEEQLRRVMANLNTEMTNGLKSDDTENLDLAMFPTYVHHGPSGQESGEYLVVDLGGSNFRVSHVSIEGRNRMRLNNKIFLIPHSLLLGEGEKLFDYIAECLQRFIDDNKLSLLKSANYKFDLAFTFSFPCKQTSLREATLVSWTKGFSCTSVVGNDVVLMLQQAIDRRKGLKIQVVALVNDTVGTLMACSSIYRDCKAGVILGTGTNACYFENLDNVPKWTGVRDNIHKQVIINTEWGALGRHGCLDFIRTDIDRELDESSLTPHQQVFEKMISALYLGEIVRLIIVDLVQRSILFPGRMQKSPSIRPDYNIFLILRGSFYAKHVADIENDTTEDLSITTTILTSIGIHDPSYDDCYIIREVCKTVSLRAAKLAAAAVAVLINRLNMSSVTVAIDGTLFRHHQQFKHNLTRTLGRLVPRTHRLVLSEDGSSKGSALVAAVDRRLKTAPMTYDKTNLPS